MKNDVINDNSTHGTSAKQKIIRLSCLAVFLIIMVSCVAYFAFATNDPVPPDNLNGCIIVFYRNSCPDCQATMPQIRNAFSSTKDVYYVKSRSKLGKKIREQYPISEVPTAVYIHVNDDNYTSYVLYKKTDDGETIPDYDAINRITELKTTER